jgi:hypothetical protein
MNCRRLGRPLAGLPAVLLLAVAALAPFGAMAQASPPQTAPAAADSPATATDEVPSADAGNSDAKPPAEQGPPDQSKVIQLNGVTVQGKHDPLAEGDKHLKQLQDSLPCNGCDAKPQTHKKLVSRVLNAVGERVLPTEAPDHSTRDPNDKAAEFSQENVCSASNVGGCVPSNARP